MPVLKISGISILVLSLLLVGCGTDVDDTSNLISDVDDINIELEPTSYIDSDLPEILSSSDLKPGKYKMSVGEALICRSRYIYFQRGIGDDKVRVYLDPPIESGVDRYTTFGTILTEYNNKFVIEIIGSGELDNPCVSNPKDNRSDSIAGLYIGRIISMFE